MARGLGELLRYPFARPPGRRILVARLAPEIFAVLVWGLFLWLWLRAGSETRLGIWESLRWAGYRFKAVGSAEILSAALSRAALVASEVGSGVLLLAPIAFIAPAFALEHRTGTMESILLTSSHHNVIVKGRFWWTSLPWFRIVFYMLPFYALIAFEPMMTFSCASWSCPGMNVMAWIAQHDLGNAFLPWREAVTAGPSRHTLFLAVMRCVHDLSLLALAVGVSFYVSLRAKTLVRSVLIAYVIVPLVALVALNPDVVWFLGALLLPDIFMGVRMYWLMVLLVIAMRWGLVFALLKRCGDNFTAYVLGEKSGGTDHWERRRRRTSALRSGGKTQSI